MDLTAVYTYMYIDIREYVYILVGTYKCYGHMYYITRATMICLDKQRVRGVRKNNNNINQYKISQHHIRYSRRRKKHK